MDKSKIFEVAIIGAGLSGIYLSILLAKAGVSVCLIDKSDDVDERNDFRELLSFESLLQLELINNNGILNNVKGIEIKKSVFKWNSTSISVKNHLANSPLSISKNSLIRELRGYANTQSISLFYNSLVTNIIDSRTTHSELSVKTMDGTKLKINAEIIVLATGRTSKRFIDNSEKPMPEYIAQGVKTYCTEYINDTNFYLEGLSSSKMWWYALPVNKKEHFICLCCPLEESNKYIRSTSGMNKLYKETLLLKDILGELKFLDTPVYRWSGAYQWSNIYYQRWVTVGDAAYSSDPLSGRGADFALFSAKLLYEAIQSKNLTEAIERYSQIIQEYVYQQTVTKELMYL